MILRYKNNGQLEASRCAVINVGVLYYNEADKELIINGMLRIESL